MSKKLTIKEIAALANTSKTTVSFYLNKRFENMSEATKSRIEKVINEHNYTPNMNARFLSIQKSNLIGVLVGDITNTFSNQLVKGIETAAHLRGYQIVIGSSNYDKNSEMNFIQRLIRLGVDGFIVQPTSEFDESLKFIEESGKEIVFIDSNSSNENVASVKSDNYTSVSNCVEKIVQQDYYDDYVIVHANPKHLSTRLERANGFIDSMEKYGKQYSQIIVSNNASEQEVKEKITPLIRLDKKTLVFVPNCWLLPTVYLVLGNYRNLIPNVLGVVGFDNTEWTNIVVPSVTTIVQPAYKEGEVVANKVIDLIEKQEVISKEILLCDVNWQESVMIK